MYAFLKRGFDIFVSLAMILCLSPLFAVVTVVLRLSGEREVFYLQKRIGLNNEYFHIYKFATMLKNSLQMGTGSITLRDDPRVTPIGKLLRKTKVNEFPQLFNVLIGDMSLVGPRPFVDDTFDAYPKHVQERIYNCKPGLTGIGSIVYRDEESLISASDVPPATFYRERISPHKGELELWYQDHRTFWVDLCILLLTAATVVFPSAGESVYRVFKGLPRPNTTLVGDKSAAP